MKTFFLELLFIGALFYTGICKPADNQKQPIDDLDYDAQNDGEDYDADDYGTKDDDVNDNTPKIPIRIETEPLIITKYINEDVILPCKITPPNASYVDMWRINETPVYQSGMLLGNTHRNLQYINGSIYIKNVQPKDSGHYKCEILTDGVTKPSVTHILNVYTPPEIINIYAKDNITRLNVGDTLKLTCEANGYPKPNISWHKGAERLGDLGETLTITDVKHRDAGPYRCLADNKIGDPAYKQIEIKVDFKPMVQIEKIFVNSDTNHNAELKCIVHAEPKANVLWKKNGENIQTNERIQLEHNKHNYILLIKNLQEDDFGIYSCYANNSLGAVEKTITLTRTPAILEFLQPKKGAKDVVLTWKVESKSPINEHELQYRKKGTNDWMTVKPEITDNEEGVYMVKYTLKGLDGGTYETRLRSQNSHGWSDYSEIRPFEGVYAKQEKRKKSHKGIKEKHNKTTQEAAQNEDEIPPEPSQNDSVIGASQTGGSSILRCSSLLYSLLLVAVAANFRQ